MFYKENAVTGSVLDETIVSEENSLPQEVSEVDLSKTEDEKAKKWNRRMLVISLIVAIFFPSFNIAYNVIHDRSIKKYSDARFGTIETALRLLTAMVAPQLQKAMDDSLASAISIKSGNEAGAKLVFAKSVVRQLRDAKAILPISAVSETNQKLTTVADRHTDLPETWSVIGDFLTYRSQMIEGWPQTDLPLCIEVPNQFQITKETINGAKTVATHGPIELHDCKIVLDSPGFTSQLSADLRFADVIFTHCAVFYGGGPIILLPIKLSGEPEPRLVGSMIFKNCVFVLSFSNVPGPQGQKLARILLTATGATVRLDGSTG